MIITIINGSPRKNGATGRILQAFKNRLEENEDVDVHYIDLVDCDLLPCSGCENCYRTGSCHLKDKAEEINRSISFSQGVIIGSPTYVSNVSGLLKNYIDRGHIVVEQALKDKYMFAVTTYEISGGSNVIRLLNTMFQYAGGIPSGKFALKLDHNNNPFEHPRVLKRVCKKADQFYRAIRRNKRKNMLDRLINFVALHVVMRPSVMRYPSRYKSVLQRWKEMDIIS